jgi:dTDP-4-amino-4,6-dideoxygalactose transaminase
MYYLLVADAHLRPGLIATLDKHGINAVSHYAPLHSAPAGRRFGRTAGALDVTESVGERLVRLPLWPAMVPDEVTAVIDAVTAWAGAAWR